MKELQQYTYTIPANGSVQIPAANDNFIIQASDGPLSVRGNTFGRMRGLVAGQGFKAVPFDRLELFDESGAPNTVTLLMSPAEFVNQIFSGSVTIVGGVLTDAQLRASLVRVNDLAEPTGFWAENAARAASATTAIFTAAANLNGAILWAAEAVELAAGTVQFGFLTKATPPANVLDGNVIVQPQVVSSAATSVANCCALHRAVRIPAGLGLFYVNGAAIAQGQRMAQYTLL